VAEDEKSGAGTPQPSPDDAAAAKKRKEQKRKEQRKVGTTLLILGSLFAMAAFSVTRTAGSSYEAMGSWSVPLLCWLAGFYYFFKGGGRII